VARPELEVSVVVPSHERPLRLRWLLNALEEQTLERERWELVVVHDSRDDETEELLSTHPLASAGTMRHLRLEPGTGLPGHQRNTGWRAAHGALVAFTDDDCRPEPDWLGRMVDTARANSGAIVQGRVKPDPFETDILAAPHARTIEVDPPGPFAQTCNVLYPRALLEAVGGFEESFPLLSGEDTDLYERARATGAAYVGAPDAVVYHAVESSSLLGAVRRSIRWQHLAYVVKRHPHVRERLELGVFWRRSHALMALGLVGGLAGTRFRPAAALALPYLGHTVRRRGKHLRGLTRGTVELPGRVVIDAVEMATLARGSVRYRTVFL
jgi:GT2 family glycosyltransferase